MKPESDVKPERLVIDARGNRAIVTFNINIEEGTDEETGRKKYYYDNYTLEVTNRENLYEEIENNFDEYLQLAKKSSKST